MHCIICMNTLNKVEIYIPRRDAAEAPHIQPIVISDCGDLQRQGKVILHAVVARRLYFRTEALDGAARALDGCRFAALHVQFYYGCRRAAEQIVHAVARQTLNACV